MAFTVPYCSKERIRVITEEILNTHQARGGIPVEVEEIVEFGFEIEIRPFRALQARFGFEGALTHDLQTILVDEDFMLRVPNRYRFTLAHELGHRVLHGEIISGLEFPTKEEWKRVVSAIHPSDYGRMEAQAYVFAGLLLVPTQPLLASWREAEVIAQRSGIDLTAMGASAITPVAGRLAKEYRVSTAVMERRMNDAGVLSRES